MPCVRIPVILVDVSDCLKCIEYNDTNEGLSTGPPLRPFYKTKKSGGHGLTCGTILVYIECFMFCPFARVCR